MDIYSPKGMETVEQEAEAVEILARHMPQFQYIHTHKPPKNCDQQRDEAAATVDGLLIQDAEVKCVCETKCRVMTRGTLFGDFEGKWLVTMDKIINARQIAFHLRVPLVGLLYLVPEKILLLQRICDAPIRWELGRFATSMTLETTVTQRTVNGGFAKRTNAYIDMTNAKVFK